MGGKHEWHVRHCVVEHAAVAAVRQMLDEVTGLRQLMTLWADVKSHMLASYRTCFVNILKVVVYGQAAFTALPATIGTSMYTHLFTRHPSCSAALVQRY